MAKKAKYPIPMLDTEKVKALRIKAGLSQDDAAKAAGFKGRQAWNNFENGRQANMELATLGRIAAVLKCNPKDLLK
ncbi:MAG TPA: helix-turn-helix transcriptional regulator [Tepidisphaeraceae bacterium]|jgi:transcriptional regulator with XRE-family HTH domain